VYFHAVFNRNDGVAEMYIIHDGSLLYWTLPRREYVSDQTNFPSLVPELQAKIEKCDEIRRTRVTDFFEEPEIYPTFWREVQRYPAPFEGAFHAIPLGEKVFLLNMRGEVYRVDDDQVLQVGRFADWPGR
jgi:hypothetical protein